MKKISLFLMIILIPSILLFAEEGSELSNQWDKNSIDRLINNIELNYGEYISIITPEVANIVAYAYDEEISSIDKNGLKIKHIDR